MRSSGNKISPWLWLVGLARFVRLPNLVIVVLIEFLLRYAILKPILFNGTSDYMTSLPDFILFVITTLLLAIGGYVINDYFDIKIDRVNRPDHLVVSRIVTPHTAMKIHLAVNFVAIILGFYLAYKIHSIWFGLLFPCGAFFFWFYSARWKQLLIWKNLIVAFISALLIMLVLLFEFFHLRLSPEYFSEVIGKLNTVFLIFLGYAGFAFLVSLFREVIKDIEDLQGDEKYGTRSLPSVIGINWSKGIVIWLIVCTMFLLGYCQMVLFRIGLELMFWYFMIAVQIPAISLIIVVIRAMKKKDFHVGSVLAKLIMFTGILSMVFLAMSD